MDRNRHMASRALGQPNQSDKALRRVTVQQTARRLPADWYTTAARAEHNTHCTRCRELTAASDTAAAENGASIQRRDRRQLDLPFSRRNRAVDA